jgi:hypothetical protein
MDDDDRYMKEEQKRYVNDYNNRKPILPGSGLE